MTTKTKKRIVIVRDLMQKNYRYELVAPAGKHYPHDFKPELTPKEMLQLGVFGGKYMADCQDEFPKEWFRNVRLTEGEPVAEYNFFRVNASKPLVYWQEKGWIYPKDPRGWFQWYCRYYMGRRIPHEDERQIKRWKAIRRHVAQLKKHCRPGDWTCRPKQRQAILHWAYDSRKM